ncbi:hypothetical protein GCM10027051_15370 [Niabella terrae]
MKKIIIAASLLLFMGWAGTQEIAAQRTSSRNNIGVQPGWGPTGYEYASFYYFPDYNIYYDIAREQFIILNGRKWQYVKTLPARYQFSAYNSYKVVINDARPYRYNQQHQRQYASYKGQGKKQGMIRDSREEKYFASKQHPQHEQWNNRQSNIKKQAAKKQSPTKKSTTGSKARNQR